MFLLTCGGEFRVECYSLVKFVQHVLHEILLHEIVDLGPRIRLQYLIHVENTVGREKGERCSSESRFPAHFWRIKKEELKYEVGLGSARTRKN